MGKFFEDAIYNLAGAKSVKTGWLTNTEGTQGSEAWVFIPDKGLFHAKKHNGEWYYEKYLPKTDDDAALIQQISGETVINNVEITDGNLTTLNVTDQTTLATLTTISGSFNVTGDLDDFPVNTSNLTVGNDQLDTIQDIGYSGDVGFASLMLGSGAVNVMGGSDSGIMASEFIADKGASVYNAHTTAGHINKVVGMFDAYGAKNASGNTAYGGTNIATLPISNVNGSPLEMKSFARNQIASLQNMSTSSSTYITGTQWGYINSMDQPVHKDVSIEFNDITLKSAAPDITLFDVNTNKIWTIGMSDAGNDDLVFIGNGATPIIDFRRHSVSSQVGEFVSDLSPAGKGWRVSASVDSSTARYTLEIDNLYLRGTLDVAELVIHQVRATNGSLMLSSAARLIGLTITSVANYDPADDSDGYITGTAIFESEDSAYMPFLTGDICWARKIQPDGETFIVEQYFKVVSTTNDTAVVQLSTEDQFTHGTTFATVIVGDTLAEAELIALQDVAVVRIGSASNTARQGTIYMTTDDLNSPYIDVRDPVTSYASWAGSTVVRLGNLDGIAGATGYGLWGENVDLTGKITATSGLIANWTMAGSVISSGNVKLDAGNETIQIGTVTDFTNDDNSKSGIFMGKESSGNYDFFVGKENTVVEGSVTVDGEYIHYDDSTGKLEVKGVIHLQTGSTGLPDVDTPSTFRFKCISAATSTLYNANSVAVTTAAADKIRILKWIPATLTWTSVGEFTQAQTLNSETLFDAFLSTYATADIFAIFGSASVLSQQGSDNSTFITVLKRIGITIGQILQCTTDTSEVPALVIGRLEATVHSGASFQLGLYEDATFFETTVSGYQNTMTLVDTSGAIDDVDVYVAPRWAYESEAGWLWKPSSTSDVEKTVKVFVFPQVLADDSADVYIKITGTNLDHPGNSGIDTKMYLNDTEIALSGFGAGRISNSFKPNSEAWNTSDGGNNVIKFTVDSTNDHTNTQAINQCSVWHLNGSVYNGTPADVTPEGLGLFMTASRVGFYSGDAWTSWIGTSGTNTYGAFSFGNASTDNISYNVNDGLVLKGKMTAGSIISADNKTILDLTEGRLIVKDTAGTERVRLGKLAD